MAIPQQDTKHYLDTAQKLAALVAAEADQIDSERQLSPELAAAIADEGFFRLLVPKSLGGSELAHPDFLKILEVFAQVDGSTGWCINQNNVFATSSAVMPEQMAHEIWDESRAVVTNGPPTATVKAVPVEGGYNLSGHWNFSSGSPHATWIAALAPVGQPEQKMDASLDRAGTRMMLIPREDVTFLDSWHVPGLRGTGSFSFELTDMFIPESRSYDPNETARESGPLYVIPRTLLFASGFATVALGVARGSLDTAMELSGAKTPSRSTKLLRDQATTHRLIGEGEALWRSAKAFLRESATAVWASVCRDRCLTTEERIRLRLASTHAIRTASQVVDIAYNLCGSSAIFEENPIQRRFQDIHVITQHVQGRPTHYETAGQFFLGLEPEGNF